MKKALQVVLHLLGFPLLIALVIFFSMDMFKSGISYGFIIFVGLIATVAIALIYYVIFFLMAKVIKTPIHKQTIVLVLVVAVLLGGLWIGLDMAFPDFFADGTSNTIFYEDLADNYSARASINKAILDEFININYANGNLKDKKLNDYLEEGYRNEEVQELIKVNAKSISKDGYSTFVGPWIDFADGNRRTIPTLIHVLINQREAKGVPFLSREDGKLVDTPVNWSILDMAGNEMEFDLGENGMGIFDKKIVGIIKMASGAVNLVLDNVSDAIKQEEIIGSPMYFLLEDGQVLKIVPSNVERGVLDYKRMKWLEGNDSLLLVTALLSVRKLFLIFAGVLIITTYAIGLLREDKNKIISIQEDGDDERYGQYPYNLQEGKAYYYDGYYF